MHAVDFQPILPAKSGHVARSSKPDLRAHGQFQAVKARFRGKTKGGTQGEMIDGGGG